MRPVARRATAYTEAGRPAVTAAYTAARARARRLLAQPSLLAQRRQVEASIAELERMAVAAPHGPEAPRALMLAGELYRARFGQMGAPRDATLAQARFRQVFRDYPKTSLADDALWASVALSTRQQDRAAARVNLDLLVQRYPHGDMAPRARAMAQLLQTGPKSARPSPAATAPQVQLASFEVPPPTPAPRTWRPVLPRTPLVRPPSGFASLASQPVEQGRVPAWRRAAPPRVVIDPGHGGHDSGAVGPGGTMEKDVVLAIARRTQTLLAARGIDAVLTRSSDRFISLQDRTQLANQIQAELFISVHANSAPHPDVHGVETYTLDTAADRYAVRLAAIENQTSEKEVTDLQLILADLATKGNSQDSVQLAHGLQRHVVGAVREHAGAARDLGIKSSLFYVLLGARMPAVLLESSFVSNPREEAWLSSPVYQRRLAAAICRSVEDYLREHGL